MRCFIAVDINDDIREAVGDRQDNLKTQIHCKRSDIKWVDPKLMHLTLKFLGDVPDKDIVTVCHVAESVATNHNPFDLDIESMGHFGGRSARVLWAGVGQGKDILEIMQADLESRMEQAGWPREARRFSAHLTLCRIRNAKVGTDLIQGYQPFENQIFGTCQIHTLIVYHSQLSSQGPIYTPVGTYPLQT